MAGHQPAGLARGLSSHHISMITFSANIGFGFTLNSGNILALTGPGGAVLSYILASALIILLVPPYVEMASVTLFSGPLWELPVVFLDATLGGVLGYMFLFTFLIVYPEELAVTARFMLFDYEPGISGVTRINWATEGVSPAVWVGLALVTSTAVNLMPIRLYGHIEWLFGAIKLVCLVMFIIVQIPINTGGKVYESGATGAKYWWRDYTGFMTHNLTLGDPSDAYVYSSPGNQFLTIWTAVIRCFFGFLGAALVPVAATEATSPRLDLKSASRHSLFRVIFIYCFGILALTFNVPFNHPQLRPFDSSQESKSSNSPLIISFVEAGWINMAHFGNAFMIFATWSCATANLFASSRLLYSLARNNKLPFWNQRLTTVTNRGVPRNAIFMCALFGVLGFMGVGRKSQTALDSLTTIVSSSFLIVFLFLSITFLAFLRHLESRNAIHHGARPEFDRKKHQGALATPAQLPGFYPYATHLQPLRSYISTVVTGLMIIFGGWWVFLKERFSAEDLVGNYFALAFFVVLMVGDKAWRAWRLGDGWRWNPDNGRLLDTMFRAAPPQAGANMGTAKRWAWGVVRYCIW